MDQIIYFQGKMFILKNEEFFFQFYSVTFILRESSDKMIKLNKQNLSVSNLISYQSVNAK